MTSPSSRLSTPTAEAAASVVVNLRLPERRAISEPRQLALSHLLAPTQRRKAVSDFSVILHIPSSYLNPCPVPQITPARVSVFIHSLLAAPRKPLRSDCHLCREDEPSDWCHVRSPPRTPPSYLHAWRGARVHGQGSRVDEGAGVHAHRS